MKTTISIALLATLVACAPRLQEAAVTLPQAYTFNNGFSTDTTHLGAEWWRLFNDPRLDRLEQIALENNRDLAATLATMESAHINIRAARAEFAPAINGNIVADALHEAETTEREFSIRPTMAWELSLFGLGRNTRDKAINSYLATAWGYNSARLALTAEVATTYFTLMQYERSLALATQSFRLRQQATALVDSMYHYGMSDGTALMQARSLVYSAKAEMERYRRATTLAAISLGELICITPDKIDFRSDGEPLLRDHLPSEIPIGIPSALLERRGDIMQSYYNMQAAASQVGIQRAERYPSIALTAGGGLFATTLKGLTSGNPASWLANAQITAPIFSFGRLRRAEQMAIESYNASLYSYEQSIIEAMGEVESALAEIDTYNNETTASAALVLANTKIVENTSAMYRSGLGGYLSVIDAERELYSSQISLIDVVAEQYINYVDLIKALGGGW